MEILFENKMEISAHSKSVVWMKITEMPWHFCTNQSYSYVQICWNWRSLSNIRSVYKVFGFKPNFVLDKKPGIFVFEKLPMHISYSRFFAQLHFFLFSCINPYLKTFVWIPWKISIEKVLKLSNISTKLVLALGTT